MTKILVLYYSAYGHIEAMANAVAGGAREAGASVDIKRVPELVPPEIAKASHYKLDQVAPVARIEDLTNYDAIVVGTGTRFGRMASQMANFLDRDPARRPGNHAVLDHHQSAAFRHDRRRPELRLCGSDETRRGYRRLALWRDHDHRRRRQPTAERKRTGGR